MAGGGACSGDVTFADASASAADVASAAAVVIADANSSAIAIATAAATSVAFAPSGFDEKYPEDQFSPSTPPCPFCINHSKDGSVKIRRSKII